MKEFFLVLSPIVWFMVGFVTGWAHFAPSPLADGMWFLTMAGLLACVMCVIPRD